MPRPAPIPMKGSFDSKTGIYSFGGHTYKARWYANAQRMSIQDCKLTIEAGHREDQAKLPQAVLVVGEKSWMKIKKSYASWVGLSMFHYYDPNVNPGEIPTWLNDISAHGTKLIHEVGNGIAYLLTYYEPNAIYRYFVDCAPASYPAPAPQPAPNPAPVAPSPVLHILRVGNHRFYRCKDYQSIT